MSVPPNKRLPEKVWNLMLESMPIPCVDIIFLREDRYIVYGIRTIEPAKYTWTLPGGRIIKGESPEEAAARQAKHYGLKFKELVLNGVFSQNTEYPSERKGVALWPKQRIMESKIRSDISISFVAVGAEGIPRLDREFRKVLTWLSDIPRPILPIHEKMVQKWGKGYVH